jgi:hypothetical protein
MLLLKLFLGSFIKRMAYSHLSRSAIQKSSENYDNFFEKNIPSHFYKKEEERSQTESSFNLDNIDRFTMVKSRIV